jgi:very-short-patch-repair endonuclease
MYNTKGRYAVYGDGEYQIESLGYFPDYINFSLKLIMEYDESHHFDENGNLLERDVQRQKEIQDHFPDFEFRRIKEKDLNTIKL